MVTWDQSVPVTVLSENVVVTTVSVVTFGASEDLVDEVVVVVVATTVEMEVLGPAGVGGGVGGVGITVVESIVTKVLNVEPSPFVVVSVMDMVTTTVSNCTQ